MPRLWVIAGVNDMNEQDVPELFPGWDIEFFESCYAAPIKGGHPDAILIDVGSLNGTTGQPELGRMQAESMMARYESVPTFVCSACGGWSDIAIRDLQAAGYKPIICDDHPTTWPAVFRQYGFEVEVTENEQDPEYYRKMREADYSLEDIEAIDAEFDAALEEEE